jgi:hypothetical protein
MQELLQFVHGMVFAQAYARFAADVPPPSYAFPPPARVEMLHHCRVAALQHANFALEAYAAQVGAGAGPTLEMRDRGVPTAQAQGPRIVRPEVVDESEDPVLRKFREEMAAQGKQVVGSEG